MNRKYFRMELYRLYTSKRYWIIVLVMTAVMFGSIAEFITASIQYRFSWSDVGIIDKLFEILVFDRFKALIILLSSGIVAYTVSDDISSRFLRSALEKVTVEDYVTAKLIVNGVGIISALMLAFTLFTVILSIFGMPLSHSAGLFGYYKPILTRVPIMYIPLSATLFGMFGTALTSVGMAVTAFCPGRYLAYALPFGLFYILNSISFILPEELRFVYICSGVRVLKNQQGFFINYFYGIGLFLLIAFLAGMIFYLGMKRRVKRGRV